MEPVSHFFYSDRLKLQLWDYGQDGKPPLILVHGGMDHARSWDRIARAFSADYHVYAYDLRGHGNSEWAHGGMYTVPEHVLDLTTLAGIVGKDEPLRLVGHSLGGMIVLHYAGLFPQTLIRAVSLEGIGFPPQHRIHSPASERLRRWIGAVRDMDTRTPRSYPTPEAAAARMSEANPRLSPEVARHLTLHGTNWNSDGTISWKFDNFVRAIPPLGHDLDDTSEIFSQITSPVLFFWGLKSFAPLPSEDPRYLAIPQKRLIIAPDAGHWVHHDELELVVEETRKFLA